MKTTLRAATPWLASVAFFLFLDVTIGTITFRPPPDWVDNRWYRQPSPVFHHDLKPGSSAWASWGDRVYPIFTNSLGFRDARIRDVPRESDAWRVVLLGDSFTEGVGVPFDETFAAILGARLKPERVEVINAGVTSYSPIIYYRKLRYLIEDAKLRVDEAIVFLDISDIEDEARHYGLDESGNVVDQDARAYEQFHLPPHLPTWTQRIKHGLAAHSLTVAVAVAVRDRLRKRSVPSGTDPLADWSAPLASQRGNWTHDAAVYAAYGERGLERAASSMELLRGIGVPLTVVVYPWPNQIAARDRDSKQVTYWRAWTAAHGVGFIDLFGDFIDGRAPAIVIRAYYIRGDVHFNRAGNLQVAEAVLRSLDVTHRPLAPGPPGSRTDHHRSPTLRAR